MEKETITADYLKGLIREEKNEVTKAWMMISMDLGKENIETRKENRRLTKENESMYDLLRFHKIY